MVEISTIRCLADYENSAEEKLCGPIYGIVIDATCRNFKPHNNKYVASIRIIDAFWNKAKFTHNLAPFIKVVFISSQKDDVPNIKQIGTIIKLKDVTLKKITDSKGTIYMLTWDSAFAHNKWTIFPCAENMGIPSENEILYENKEEEKYVNDLLEFSKGYFMEHYFLDAMMNLISGKTASEFDAVVKLTKASLKNIGKDNTVKVVDLKVVDHTGKAHLYMPMQIMADEFQKLDNSCLLLIKGGKYKDLKENIIELKEFGNLMLVPNNSSVSTKFYELANLHIECSKTEDIIEKENIRKTYTISQIEDPNLPITDLNAIFIDPEPQQKYHIRVYVLEMGPRNIHDWVKGYCKECNKTFNLTDDDNIKKPHCILCDAECEVIYQVQLFVKNYKVRESEEIYRILLYTHNGKGSGFFDNEPASNLFKDKRLYKKLKGMHRLLTKFGVYIDCIVEKMGKDANSFLQITETMVGCDCMREATDK